ncbi:MAG TPA: MFS transporter [Ktedonobacterales bacterium]|nr:MFS transporter [Ktedonobacterales bacterium]
MASGKTIAGLAPRAGGALIVVTLVLLVGINLRATILSVPPLLAQIQHDLGLSYTATGLLSALPTLVMGLGAWPAGRIGGRIGGRAAVGWGMAIITVAAVARGLFPAPLTLYFFTFAIAAGVALGQTSIPMLARQWFPERIGSVSALFTVGLTLGETIAASATAPLMRVWFGPDAWPAALLMWAVPATLTLLLWLWLAPPDPTMRVTLEGGHTAGAESDAAGPARPYVGPWVIGGVMGAGSLIYFGMNGWIGPYNQAIGAAAMTPIALFAINFAQLPVTIGITPIANRLAGRRWPFVVGGVVSLIAVSGWLLTPAALQPLWGALIGGAAAGVFALSIALPALYGHEGKVARLTGSSLTISYTTAFVGPFIGGALWDAIGLPAMALAPVALAAVVLATLPAWLPRLHA